MFFIQPTMHDHKRTDIPQNARQQTIKIQLKGFLPIALILGLFFVVVDNFLSYRTLKKE